MRLFYYRLPSVLIFSAAFASDFTEVDAFLKRNIKDKVLAGGCVLVLEKGEVTYGTGFGYADISSGRPFAIDTPVIVAAMPVYYVPKDKVASLEPQLQNGDVTESQPNTTGVLLSRRTHYSDR